MHPLKLLAISLTLGQAAQALCTQAAAAIAHPPPFACPEAGSQERAEDCPWAGITRAMIAESGNDQERLASLFASLAPAVVAQIRSDATRPELARLWGQSINFDEGAKGQIVHPVILGTIGRFFEIPFGENPRHLVHAGMEHTYGYLFSNLSTPFGYKRARWVQGEIERGLGLPPGILGPTPTEGTLFLNLTTFIGRIAFKDGSRPQTILRKAAAQSARSIRTFDYASLEIIRLSEQVHAPNAQGTARKIRIHTDLVKFKYTPTDPRANSHLLIYSVLDPLGAPDNEAQLITAFPVQSDFVRRILAQEPGPAMISTRYNGYVDGLSGSPLMGTRAIIQGKAGP